MRHTKKTILNCYWVMSYKVVRMWITDEFKSKIVFWDLVLVYVGDNRRNCNLLAYKLLIFEFYDLICYILGIGVNQ